MTQRRLSLIEPRRRAQSLKSFAPAPAFASLALCAACTSPAPPPASGPAPRTFELESSIEQPSRAPSTVQSRPRETALPAADARALPASAKVEFTRHQQCTSARCTLDHWLPEPSYAFSPYEGVPAQAALWTHALTRGSTLVIPKHSELELVVVPFDGTLEARDIHSSTAATVKLPAWSALRASGAGVELECTSEACQAALALIAPGGTLNTALQQPTAGSAHQGPRTRPLEVRAFADAKQCEWNAGKSRARILFGGEETVGGAGASTLPFSLSLLESDAKVSIPEHVHAKSWENLLVLQGSGELEMRGRSYAIVGGEVIHVERGVRHGFAALGETSLVALQLYTPAGPERRFLGASEPTKPVTGPNATTNAKVLK